MAIFLAKTEAEEYSIDRLCEEGVASWTGVNNPQAKSFLRSMKKGDRVYIYHTGKEKSVVGEAIVFEEGEIPKFKFHKKFNPPIATLSDIKSQSTLVNTRIVRQSRLSVMPVEPELEEFLQRITTR